MYNSTGIFLNVFITFLHTILYILTMTAPRRYQISGSSSFNNSFQGNGNSGPAASSFIPISLEGGGFLAWYAQSALKGSNLRKPKAPILVAEPKHIVHNCLVVFDLIPVPGLGGLSSNDFVCCCTVNFSLWHADIWLGFNEKFDTPDLPWHTLVFLQWHYEI